MTFLLRRSTVFLIAGAVWGLVGLSYGLEAWKATAEQTWLQLDAMTGLVSALSQQQFDQYLRGFAFFDAHVAEHEMGAGGSTGPRHFGGLFAEFLRAYPDCRGDALASIDGRVLAGAGAYVQGDRVGRPMADFIRQLAASRASAGAPTGVRVVLHRHGMQLGVEHVSGAAGGAPLFVVADVSLRGQVKLWRQLHLPNRAERHAVMGLLSRQGRFVAEFPQTWPGRFGGASVAAGALRASLPDVARAPPRDVNRVVDVGPMRDAMWLAMQDLHGLPLAAFVAIPRSTVGLLWWRHARGALFGWLMLGMALAMAAMGYAHARKRELMQTSRTAAAERKARQSTLFYAALIEALRVLRNPQGRGREEVLQTLAVALAELLGARVAFIALSRRGEAWLDVVACAGPASAYGQGLRISASPELPEGRGPAGLALRSGKAQHCAIGDPRFAPWAARARTHGVEGALAAAGQTSDGQSALLCILYESSNPLLAHATGVMQQIADELAEFIDRDAEIARAMRCERYRSALRLIQHRLLSASSEQAALTIVSEALVAETDAVAVEVFAAFQDGSLRPRWPVQPEQGMVSSEDTDGSQRLLAQLRALAWSAGSPQFLFRPVKVDEVDTCWRQPRLAAAGCVVAWPMQALGDKTDHGVMVFTMADAAPVDEPLQDLLQRIVHSTATSLAQIRKRAHIEWLAWRDSLTGLYNRRALLERLPRMLKTARRNDDLLVVCVLDLDDFKPVNDQWGHAVGDALLCALAERLRAGLREGDCVARLGGDEFVLVVAGPSCAREALAMLERLATSLRMPYDLPGGHRVQVGLSMGLSVFPDDDSDAPRLLEHADAALYRAKSDKSPQAPRCVSWAPGLEAGVELGRSGAE